MDVGVHLKSHSHVGDTTSAMLRAILGYILEHGCRMIHAGFTCCCRLGWNDSDVPTFWLLQKDSVDLGLFIRIQGVVQFARFLRFRQIDRASQRSLGLLC